MKILILTKDEICYNIRLLKAADFFSDKGAEVTIFNTITGIASSETYKNTVAGKNWIMIENDISVRSFSSFLNWLNVSFVNKLIAILWNKFRSKIGFNYYLNKGLIEANREIDGRYDFILINLVDSLPFAVTLKKRTGARIIYDSQEYFRGQYTKYNKNLKDWVDEAESLYIAQADILLATTKVMLDRLMKDYNLAIPFLRVRNLPSKRMLEGALPGTYKETDNPELLLIWHGMTIFFENGRGLYVLLKAVANCKHKVKIHFQGLINDKQQLKILEKYMNEYDLKGKVVLLPPAEPYHIVESLTGYDIGLCGELPEDENHVLTSANKLFDYINAGLAVIGTELPGPCETIDGYGVGYTYPPGDHLKLAEKIDFLAENRNILREFKKRSKEVAEKELFWEHDYKEVWEVMEKLN